ncbi:MAG: translation elongation factor 4 [Bacillota bacterium]|jgi:GTP-binding protein LepA|nr:translation elongation factor 4 [Bacillota bacterium]NLJ03443.1 elongation factor 4 [Bacillota bacterium]
MGQKNIRNFCIIAHIDHGKSTLADRILEYTGAVSKREMSEQVLDSMDLERERGITIKLKAVRLTYKAKDGQEYILNLIDTPGHVDFSYEVSRSLAACEGALLVIDASQGIEAQTLANLYLALDHDLEIIPVINKIDLPNADPERVIRELEDNIGIPGEDAVLVSARTGVGIEDILETIVERIPPPQGDPEAPTRAMIFDSHYDQYRGAVAYARVVDGTIRVGEIIQMMSTGRQFEVTDLGVLAPNFVRVGALGPGDVGCIIASMKDVRDTRVGDTVTVASRPAAEALSGYRPAKPMVYCGLYPVINEEYTALRDALDKLQLNDAALTYEAESSAALGFGYRCGFLGLLHLEIVQERLEREFDLDLITTAPSVVYQVVLTDGTVKEVDNPSALPPVTKIDHIKEPYVKASIMVPDEFVGAVMDVCQDRRGIFVTMEYITPERARLEYELPLAEILMDFFDRLKSRTKGYASLDYEFLGYRESQVVKLDILLNGNPVDALSCIVHQDKALSRGRALAEKLKEVIPRQQFEVPIQAAIGNKIIARETVRALRKDVLAKCYGGDVSRKRKLLEKQKEGKKRMKSLGNVEVPQEAFMAILQVD